MEQVIFRTPWNGEEVDSLAVYLPTLNKAETDARGAVEALIARNNSQVRTRHAAELLFGHSSSRSPRDCIPSECGPGPSARREA
jgi:hypothetical protein